MQYVYQNTSTEPTVKWFLPPNLYDDRPSFLRALKRRRIVFPEALSDLNRLLHSPDFRTRIRDITVAWLRSEIVDPNAVESLRQYYKYNKHEVLERCLPNTLNHADYVEKIIACYSRAGAKRFVWVMQLQQTIPGFVTAVHEQNLEPENMALAINIARDGYVNFERVVGIVLGRKEAYGQEFEIAFIYSYTKPEEDVCATMRCVDLVSTAALVLQQMEMLAPGRCQVGPSPDYIPKDRRDIMLKLQNARDDLQVCEPPMRTGEMLIELRPPLEKRFTFLVHDMKASYCAFDEGLEPNKTDSPPQHLPVAVRAPVTPAQLCANTADCVASASPPSAASGAHSIATHPALYLWRANHSITRGDLNADGSVASAAPAALVELATAIAEPANQQIPNRMDILDAPTTGTEVVVLPTENEIVEIDSDEDSYVPGPWITVPRPQRTTNPITRPPVGYYAHPTIPLEVQTAGLRLQSHVVNAALCYATQNIYNYERLLIAHPALCRGMAHFDARAMNCLLSAPSRDGVFMQSQVKLAVFVGLGKKRSAVRLYDFAFVVTSARERTAAARARTDYAMVSFIIGVRRLVGHMLAYKDDEIIPRFAVQFGGGPNDVAQIRE